jgi:hypothetical protein
MKQRARPSVDPTRIMNNRRLRIAPLQLGDQRLRIVAYFQEAHPAGSGRYYELSERRFVQTVSDVNGRAHDSTSGGFIHHRQKPR